MTRGAELHALKFAVAICGTVPVAAGTIGAWRPELLDIAIAPSPSSHVAYLSGLLLGIGLGFWSTVPAIERQRARFTLLTALVLLGGLARLLAAVRLDVWTLPVTLPLAMELAVTPALWLWQRRVARLA